MTLPVSILSTGLVTSVGLSAPAACAAMRAGLSNASETRFIDAAGEPIIAHQVPLGRPLRGRARLAGMAAMAISECLAEVPPDQRTGIPLMLCVAEPDRPGRLEGLDDELLQEIEQQLGTVFADESLVVPYGRVSVAVALTQARRLIAERRASRVLVAASDSYISSTTLTHYGRGGRLLTAKNSNGFIPGEGAGALLVGTPAGQPALVCSGFGFAVEQAHIASEVPLRGDGLTQAIVAALGEAGRDMREMDFRITDLSGEHYYFKEAALALARTLRVHKEAFPIWHPAECIGEQGATAGIAVVAMADAACKKEFATGNSILAHMAIDGGQRAAMIMEFRAS